MLAKILSAVAVVLAAIALAVVLTRGGSREAAVKVAAATKPTATPKPKPKATQKPTPTATQKPTPGPAKSTPTAAPTTPAAPAPALLPLLVTQGGYSGIEPTTLGMGASNAIIDISWSQWNANGAVGSGKQEIDSCNPNCAEGSTTYKTVTLTLGGVAGASATDGGYYTTFSETDSVTGAAINSAYFPFSASGGTQGNY
jgi:hypothetical protein